MNTLAVFTPLATDQKTIAERQWRESNKAPAPQQPLNVGLFGDSHLQISLFSATKEKAETAR